MSDSPSSALSRLWAGSMGVAAVGFITAGVFLVRLERAYGRVPLGGAAAVLLGAYMLYAAIQIYRKVRGTS